MRLENIINTFAFFTCDSKGKILYCNENFASLLNEKSDRILGKELQTYFGEERSGHAVFTFQEAMYQSRRYKAYLKGNPKTCIQLSFQMYIEQRIDTEYVFLGMASLEDNEEVLITSPKIKMYEDVLNVIPDSIFILNRSAHIVYLNETASKQFGKPKETIIGTIFYEHISNEGQVLIKEKLGSSSEDSMLWKDFNLGIWTEYHCQPILDANKEVQFLVVLGKDFSKRREFEEDFINGLVSALEIRDFETVSHSERVAINMVMLARYAGFSEGELIHIRHGALLHDIGKLGIPDSILLKNGPLTEIERKVICKHPVYAYDWLSRIDFLIPAIDIPYLHHEKWDGTGYPNRLKGEEIPLAARIFAVLDVWDALTSDRPYRKAFSEEEALQMIHEMIGTHFDPKVAELFFAHLDEMVR